MKNKRPLQSVKKFYFLDYFYILLRSVEKESRQEEVFTLFKMLKQKHRLGESKYKRLTTDGEVLTLKQQQRYKYTFRQVVEESREYKLVFQGDDDSLRLTENGQKLLQTFDDKGFENFLRELVLLMEDHFGAFRALVEFMYSTNKRRSGVLIFPHYSPLELNFQRKEIQTGDDIRKYTIKLIERLEKDIYRHLNRTVQLSEQSDEILERLVKDDLLPSLMNKNFHPSDYNKITKRIRDFWINYFLKSLYECPYAMSTFDLWVYRAKQAGIIHATEFYPFTNGKLVYPTGVVLHSTASSDFVPVYKYSDGSNMFLHEPNSDSFRDQFVNELVKGYFSLRTANKNYFINLASLREVVCYALKISSFVFGKLLDDVYKLNLQGEMKIRISLEVDKLPEETNAMYLKREPVMVDGSYRNIIAIDVTKGEKKK